MYGNRKYFVIGFNDGSIYTFQMMSGGEKLEQFIKEHTNKYKCFDTQDELNHFLAQRRKRLKEKEKFNCIKLTDGNEEW